MEAQRVQQVVPVCSHSLVVEHYCVVTSFRVSSKCRMSLVSGSGALMCHLLREPLCFLSDTIKATPQHDVGHKATKSQGGWRSGLSGGSH